MYKSRTTQEHVLLDCLGRSRQALALFDPDDRLCFANDQFVELFHVDQRTRTFASIMRACYERKKGLLIETDNIEAWLDGVQKRRRNAPERAFEADFVDGRWVWVTELLRADGWLYFSGTDITSLKNNEKALRHSHERAVLASHTDSLTGLYNRRFIDAHLQDAFTRLAAYGTPFSMCLLDLDHFKQANDRFGHPAGDRVLEHFAAQIKLAIRPADIAGRIGGEEFVVILPDTAMLGATLAMDRLRLSLGERVPLPDMPELLYTFSAGITQAIPNDNLARLMDRVDRALYQAKHAGRNCSVASVGEPFQIGQ
jgi:diguanylate cyclase (GGDEF)-like protein